MPMWQQPFQNVTNILQQHQGGDHCRRGGGKSASTNNSNNSSISINPSPTNTVGHMEVVITLVQPVAHQPNVTDLMSPSKQDG
eukprot:1158486-Ditylum_brightwellii.AAC.1